MIPGANSKHMLGLLQRNLFRTAKTLSSQTFLHNSRIVYLPFGLSIGLFSSAMAESSKKTILDFEVTDIDGNQVSLEKYKGFVTLIVNVASKWGFTKKNYTQLTELHQRWGIFEVFLAIDSFVFGTKPQLQGQTWVKFTSQISDRRAAISYNLNLDESFWKAICIFFLDFESFVSV